MQRDTVLLVPGVVEFDDTNAGAEQWHGRVSVLHHIPQGLTYLRAAQE